MLADFELHVADKVRLLKFFVLNQLVFNLLETQGELFKECMRPLFAYTLTT